MGITFGCEKFHYFACGRTIVIGTDHRPLLVIASKGIGDMPPRLQRFFLRLLKYDYPLQFVRGKELLLAHMLSRALTKPRDATASRDDVEVHAVAAVTDRVSRKTMIHLVAATAQDPDLQSAIRYMREEGNLVGVMKPFAAELSLVEGIVLKGTKVAIPKLMRA